MPLEIKSSVQEDLNITEFNIKEEEEPSIYDLQFLVYRLDLQREHGLSDLETKIISFILTYGNISNKFYFGNESLGRIFDKSVRSISGSISSLEEKGLIKTDTTMRANGGTIRFIRLDKNCQSDTQKTASPTRRKLLENNNKINKNKNNIYICSFETFWERYPKKVGKSKTESVYNKLVSSKKKEDEIMQGLDKYINKWHIEKTNKQYIPNPLTWLNQERWLDEVEVNREVYNKFARKNEETWKETKKTNEKRYVKDDGKLVELDKFYEKFKV